MKFELTILGCGSATPTLRRNPTAQVLNVQEKYFLIDCGEGTQLQMRRYKIRFQRINTIFISHLHGDHYLGLIGFISTMHLLGRNADLHVYGPAGLKEIIVIQLRHSQTYLRFNIVFHEVDPTQSELIYEDSVVTVHSIPLKHRIDCSGFLFREKKKPRKMLKPKIEEYNVSVEAIPKIKNGEDYILEDGTVIPNVELTEPSANARSYAYCSDTAFNEALVPLLYQIDLLYHEATFLEEMRSRAIETFHSTAKQAAIIAKEAQVKRLIIGHYSARYKDITPFLLEAKEVFDATILADDGAKYQIEASITEDE